MVYDEDEVKIVRGRTANSQNALHRGYRYCKAGKSTVTGRQAWRCVKKNDKCNGRLYTLDGALDGALTPHLDHCQPDIVDCEVREALSTVHDLAVSSHSTNQMIYCATTGPLSQGARIRLPSEQAVKKQAQRARRKENPRPTAPTSLADLTLEEDDCHSLAGDGMLLFDNQDPDRRIIILFYFISLFGIYMIVFLVKYKNYK